MAATGATPAYQNPEKWSNHAPSYKMPSTTFQANLMKTVYGAADSIYPLSSKQAAILDDGCGPGNGTEYLIKTHGNQLSDDARILAADFAAGMVEQVNLLKARETDPLWQRVETSVQDAMDLKGIKDGELTHVASVMCIFMVPQPSKAIAEAHRVLAPGGAFVFTSFKTLGWLAAMEVICKEFPDFNPVFPIPEDMKSADSIKAMLVEAGFVEPRTAEVQMPMELPEDMLAFWTRFMKVNNPGNDTMFPGWSDKDKDRAAEIITKDFKARGIKTLNNTAIVASAKKPLN